MQKHLSLKVIKFNSPQGLILIKREGAGIYTDTSEKDSANSFEARYLHSKLNVTHEAGAHVAYEDDDHIKLVILSRHA